MKNTEKFQDQDYLEEKTIRVIESCTNIGQLSTASTYVELYFKKTQNVHQLRYLMDRINIRHHILSSTS